MAGNSTEDTVSAYYHDWDVSQKIDALLREEGIDPQHVTVEQLAPLEHFHSFGSAGTVALGRLLQPSATERALDVGGGIGGPARLLASLYHCSVTVLDLTQAFCDAGTELTARTHLSDAVSFVCANALAMPFADGSFDLAWTQHASVNIADKARLYAEVHRVLRPGGRFGMFDIMAGPQQPLTFPLPWATEPNQSFLITPENARTLLTTAGFTERAWYVGADALAQLATDTVPPSRLNTGLLMGPTAEQRVQNAMRDQREGRATLVLGVFERQ